MADGSFLLRLQDVFPGARAETIRFPNPLRGDFSSSTVYVALRTGKD
jgi:hypothetical protein